MLRNPEAKHQDEGPKVRQHRPTHQRVFAINQYQLFGAPPLRVVNNRGSFRFFLRRLLSLLEVSRGRNL